MLVHPILQFISPAQTMWPAQGSTIGHRMGSPTALGTLHLNPTLPLLQPRGRPGPPTAPGNAAGRCPGGNGEWGEWSLSVAISPSPHVPIVPSQIAGTSSPFHMTLHNRDTDPRAPSLDHLKRNAETPCRWRPSRCTLSGLPLGPPLHWPLKIQAIGQGCIHLLGKVWGVKCWNPGLYSRFCPVLVCPWALVSPAVKWRPPTLEAGGAQAWGGETRSVLTSDRL